MTSIRFTSADLEFMPDDGKRYEIIDGELYVSRAPDCYHQMLTAEITGALHQWNRGTGLGSVAVGRGLTFANDDDVTPDLTWTSKARLALIADVRPRREVVALRPGGHSRVLAVGHEQLGAHPSP